MSITSASAPGTLMLFGEHAVLHGHLAMACAVASRLTVSLEARSDRTLLIHSALGDYEGSLDHPADDARFRFILAAVAAVSEQLPTGFSLRVESDFPATVGLGSSAAVTVVTQLLLHQQVGQAPDAKTLFDACLRTVRQVQGLGSGTDLAACIHGGTVAYRVDPFEWTPVPMNHPITLVYSGYKTPTPEVVRQVQQRMERDPDRFAEIFSSMDETTLAATEAVRNHDWRVVGMCMNQSQTYMQQMGVSDPTLDDIVTNLQRQPSILGAKISGSGLGDCVIGLGTADVSGLAYESIPTAISDQGACLE